MTKPSCTTAVSHPNEEELNCQRVPSCTDTALAANHNDMPSNSAQASSASIRHRRGSESAVGAADVPAVLAMDVGRERLTDAMLMRRSRGGDPRDSASREILVPGIPLPSPSL